MVARPGRQQSAFTAGEVDPALHDRTSTKFYGNGMQRMVNVLPIAQGGFELTDGMRYVARVADDADTLSNFTANNGDVFDLSWSAGKVEIFSKTAKVAEVVTPYTADQSSEITFAQRLDTLVVFHQDVQTRRLRRSFLGVWSMDLLPYEALPRYDYGGYLNGTPYANGVDAIWRLQSVNLNDEAQLIVTVNGQDTGGIPLKDEVTNAPLTDAQIAAALQAAIRELSIVNPTITVTVPKPAFYDVTFVGNKGDDWAVSVRVVNRPEGSVLAYKKTRGEIAGEPIISNDRGWPGCGCFSQQRLIIGGMKSLPGDFGVSILGEYFRYDDRLKEANGSFFVPLDLEGGERILRIVPGRNLQIFTTHGEYWIENRTISKKEVPNVVTSSRNGTARDVVVVENEGATLYAYSEQGEIGEFRYADTEGSFVSSAISILSSHLVRGVSDMAVRRSGRKSSGNTLAVIADEGLALARLLREQDVTGFGRRHTAGVVKAVLANGRNELSLIVERTVDGAPQRFLERLEPDLLFDAAVTRTATGMMVSDLQIHEGEEVWAEDGKDVFGPFTVVDGAIALTHAPAGPVTVGRWTRPLGRSLPPPRDVGPNIVVQRPIRIHSLVVSVQDTTSLALEVNGKPPKDLPLRRYGDEADVGELEVGKTGLVTARGFTGFKDQPFYDVTQVRPGRLSVRAVTAEASIS